MVKILQFTIFLILFPLLVFSQSINVVDNTSSFPLGDVMVYAENKTDTLYTTYTGDIDLSLFEDEDIIHFVHDFFSPISYTKKELVRKKVVRLSRGDILQDENKSSLSVEEYSKDLPFYMDIIDIKENSIFQTSTEDIGVSQKVMYEKNQSSGTTVFRGLEANKVLLVVDGVRMNNAIYRYGRVPNVIDFEGSMLERTQQIYGSSFLIYSSDASGGVIHYLTKQPEFAKEKTVKFNMQAISQYATATETWKNNINFNFALKKIATFTSITYSDYGNIHVGKNRDSRYDDDFGLHKYYVETINQKDTMLENQNPEILLNTDYNQLNILNKIHFSPNENLSISTTFQYSKTSKLGIYSGITEINGDNNRYAVCEFAPNENIFSSLNILIKKSSLIYTYFSILSSFQQIGEYRITRKFNNPLELHQIEKLNVAGLNFDFIKLIDIHRLIYGFSATYNDLSSNALFKNISTDSTSTGLNRYPTNGTKLNNFSFYTNFKWLIHPQFIANAGIRYEYFLSESKFSSEKPQLELGFSNVKYDCGAPSASLSFDAYPFSGFQLSLISSTAYHVPIVDEYGKVMTKNFVVVVPNNALKPEKSLNLEISATQTFFESLRLNVTAFNTWLKDAIILTDYQLNGNDSLFFGTDRYEITTKSNIKMAQIYGLSSSLSFGMYFHDSEDEFIKFKTSINIIEGRNLDEDIAYPNISPLYGQNSLNFQYQKFGFSFSHVYNGLKKYEDLSPVGEDYIEKATPYGFLNWQTINFRISYNFWNRIYIQIAVNNALDTFFRTYASAVSAPGRNFVGTVKIKL